MYKKIAILLITQPFERLFFKFEQFIFSNFRIYTQAYRRSDIFDFNCLSISVIYSRILGASFNSIIFPYITRCSFASSNCLACTNATHPQIPSVKRHITAQYASHTQRLNKATIFWLPEPPQSRFSPGFFCSHCTMKSEDCSDWRKLVDKFLCSMLIELLSFNFCAELVVVSLISATFLNYFYIPFGSQYVWSYEWH